MILLSQNLWVRNLEVTRLSGSDIPLMRLWPSLWLGLPYFISPYNSYKDITHQSQEVDADTLLQVTVRTFNSPNCPHNVLYSRRTQLTH